MKKRILTRSLMGAPVGLTICTVITIISSINRGTGEYYPVSPALMAACGGEMRAVVLQTVLAMVYGAMWGGASVIWEMENWSPLKMTLCHLAVCSTASFLIAYPLQWMSHDLPGVFRFFGVIFAVYAVIWFSKYRAIRRQVEQMNSKLEER